MQGVIELACMLLYLLVLTLPSHITVCGNGAHSGKGIVHYHKNNLLRATKSPACVVYHGVKRRHAVVSYKCTIGNMKTQQEAELEPQVWVVNDLQGTSRDIFGFIYKTLFHFICNLPSCSAKL